MQYYTYAYLRKDGTPYYIGKGKNNRAFYKTKNEIKPPRDKSRIIFLKQNLTEEEAFKHEKYMIAVFGRKDLETGILYNRTNGGEGSSGLRLTEEQRKRRGEIQRGRPVKESVKLKIKNKLLGVKWDENRIESLKSAMNTEKVRKKQLEGIQKYNERGYKITTPDNEDYFVISTIVKLVEILPLSRASIKRLIHNKKELVKGWKIERIHL
jgi:hypothetical protein